MNVVMPMMVGLHVQFWLCNCLVMQMLFSVNVVNTKVVGNFFILLVLKVHDFRRGSLRVIDFRSLLSSFAYPLDRSE